MKTKIIEIPFHKENPQENFADVLDILSHALEAVDMQKSEKYQVALNYLYSRLGEVFQLGELIEKMMYSTKSNKQDPNIKKMCCPFHEEKTPSCAVNVGSYQFYCFGCGEEGDIHQHAEKFKEFLDAD